MLLSRAAASPWQNFTCGVQYEKTYIWGIYGEEIWNCRHNSRHADGNRRNLGKTPKSNRRNHQRDPVRPGRATRQNCDCSEMRCWQSICSSMRTDYDFTVCAGLHHKYRCCRWTGGWTAGSGSCDCLSCSPAWYGHLRTGGSCGAAVRNRYNTDSLWRADGFCTAAQCSIFGKTAYAGRRSVRRCLCMYRAGAQPDSRSVSCCGLRNGRWSHWAGVLFESGSLWRFTCYIW